MKWVADRTGRFPQRPHYEMEELDRECERMVNAFLRKKHRRAHYPISTDDLTVLVEQEAGSLDLYAELDGGVEGETDFYREKKPLVRIAHQLSEDERRENRLRTTLTHELGHVKYHNFLWFFEQGNIATPFTAAGNTADAIFPPCTDIVGKVGAVLSRRRARRSAKCGWWRGGSRPTRRRAAGG